MTVRHTKDLIKSAKDGDKEALGKIVEENSGLVWSIVTRFIGRGCETEDLFQIGSIGLIKAVERFDEGLGLQFSTYAVPMIMGEIRRFLRDDGIIKVSRSVKETAAKAGYCIKNLQSKLGREPTISELSETLGIPTEELTMALEATSAPDSIYRSVGDSDSSTLLLDKISSEMDVEEDAINKVAVRELLKEAEPKERQIIYYRYFKDKTQSEIAKMLNISQVQVSRIEKRLLKRLREKLVGKNP